MRVQISVLASLGLAACGWFPGVDSSYLIDRTRIFAIRAEVVEIGPAWPDRIGFDPDDAPITEAMPGDRIRLSGLIVGPDGRARPSADFDAVWFFGGYGYGYGYDFDRPRCQDIEWTTEDYCELGRGGEIEFELPPIGPNWIPSGISLLAIFALEPDIDAEQCFALYREPGPDLHKCGVVLGVLEIGPRWGLMAELAQAGVEVDFPLTEIPYPAFQQAANRLPMPGPMIWSDADTGEVILGDPVRVHAGQALIGEGPAWRPADRQPFVIPREVIEDEVYVFLGDKERLNTEWYYSEGLRLFYSELGDIALRVDEDAEPGPASVVMLFSDERDAYSDSAHDFRVIEFEVVP